MWWHCNKSHIKLICQLSKKAVFLVDLMLYKKRPPRLLIIPLKNFVFPKKINKKF